MDQILLRLKQLNIATKQQWRFNFTLIFFSNKVNITDLSKDLSRDWGTYLIFNQLCQTLIEDSVYKL